MLLVCSRYHSPAWPQPLKTISLPSEDQSAFTIPQTTSYLLHINMARHAIVAFASIWPDTHFLSSDFCMCVLLGGSVLRCLCGLPGEECHTLATHPSISAIISRPSYLLSSISLQSQDSCCVKENTIVTPVSHMA